MNDFLSRTLVSRWLGPCRDCIQPSVQISFRAGSNEGVPGDLFRHVVQNFFIGVVVSGPGTARLSIRSYSMAISIAWLLSVALVGASASADCDGVHPGGCEHRKRCGIGITFQFLFLLRLSETGFEIGVESKDSRREAVSDPRRKTLAGNSASASSSRSPADP